MSIISKINKWYLKKQDNKAEQLAILRELMLAEQRIIEYINKKTKKERKD